MELVTRWLDGGRGAGPGPLERELARSHAILPPEQERQHRAEILDPTLSAAVERDLRQVLRCARQLHHPQPRDRPSYLGRAAQARAREPHTCHFPEAGRMLQRLAGRPPPVIGPAAEAQMEPERLGERDVPPDVDGEVDREVGGPVLPGGERDAAGARLGGPLTQAERGRTRAPPGPPRPDLGQGARLTLGFCRIVDPDQLQVGVAEEEPAAGGALAGVGVGRALGQAERGEPLGFRAWDPLESTCRHASLSIL